MTTEKCKICRRQGAKLFLKGERCFSQKCSIIRKPYPPGIKSKKRKNLSEYGKELRETQKLKKYYNLKGKQFGNYVKEVLEKRGKVEDASLFLIKKIVSRLDNVVFCLGFANSRAKARQLVNHNHFLVNGKKVNIPSYRVKKGDIIKLAENSRKKPVFTEISAILKKRKHPLWVEFDGEKTEAKIVSDPVEDADVPAEISTIFEFYSR